MKYFHKLPDLCYAIRPSTQEIVVIRRGNDGYLVPVEKIIGDVDELNKGLGVTIQQRKAMEFGATFGWDIPATDPDIFDEKGNMIP